MSRLRIVGSVSLIALGGTLACCAAASSLTVTVLDGGSAVPGALVCVGTLGNRSAVGAITTNSAGVAVFERTPAGPFLITASHLGRGGEVVRTLGASSSSVALALGSVASSCGPPPPVQPLPHGSAVPGGGTVVVPSPFMLKETPVLRQSVFTPVTFERKTEYCFGALGAGCGTFQSGIPFAALCAVGRCSINGGSWRHDECCSAHPMGMSCRNGPADEITGHDGHCVSEWNRALNGLAYAWNREVDFTKPNSTGVVVFADYCAKRGSRVHSDDVMFCCSGQFHALKVASKFADTTSRICD